MFLLYTQSFVEYCRQHVIILKYQGSILAFMRIYKWSETGEYHER